MFASHIPRPVSTGLTRSTVLIALGLVMLLAQLAPTSAYSVTVSWRQHPQREQLELHLPVPIQLLDVRRIEELTVRVALSTTAGDAMADLELPEMTGNMLLADMTHRRNELFIQTTTADFGFVAQFIAPTRILRIDFFPDPLGRRWQQDNAIPAQADPPIYLDQALGRGDAPSEPEFGSIFPDTLNIPAQLAHEGATLPLKATASQDIVPAPAQPNLIHEPLTAEGAPENAPVAGQSMLRAAIQHIGPDEARPLLFSEPAAAGTEPEAPDMADSAGTEMDASIPTQPLTQNVPFQPSAFPRETIVPSPPPSVVMEQEDFFTENATLATDLSLPVAEEPIDQAARHRTLLAAAKSAMMNADFAAAVESLKVLSTQTDTPSDILEEALYDLGDALFALHQSDLAGSFTQVAQAYERAMNVNPQSKRAALALRNLGVLHLRVNNLPEAKAYFNVLLREYPLDPLVPSAEYYLGDYFLERGDYNQAADHFQKILQNHPEHGIAQQASIGLAKALNALGFDEQAYQIMDFLEKRWPRYYIEDPALLELAGVIALRVNDLESARQRLLTYYNLTPDTPDAHMILARLGDIFLLTGKPDPAKRIFEKTAREFPTEEGGLIARMRLVEGGIHDDPSLDDMFYSMKAAQVYSEIIANHPASPLAAVATIKLAIWQVWNKRLEDSLMVVGDFLRDHPQHSLTPKAMEVAMEAFSQLVQRNIEDGRYAEILEQWGRNVFLHPLLNEFSPRTQLGLALAFWKSGDHERAIILARPYLADAVPRDVLTSALDLILGIHLEQQEWERIVELAPLRDDPEIPVAQHRELTYALALAFENLGRTEEAHPLWLGLAEDLSLSNAQRGYVMYFLARKAMQNEELENVYLYAQEGLSLMLLDREDPGKIRDAVTWLTQVTERSGRLQEALAWALELDQRIDQGDSDWAMTRYRLAQLYQRIQDHEQWRAVLEDLRTKDPAGLYGRLAASALQGRTLEDSAGRFVQ